MESSWQLDIIQNLKAMRINAFLSEIRIHSLKAFLQANTTLEELDLTGILCAVYLDL